ncbi:MAG TPA: methylenetetrahydrofolate reductase [Acidimicrobiales bacterium]|nr:methylenetetrahydrofolate reductase [Acidimicrobiales bacterium]
MIRQGLRAAAAAVAAARYEVIPTASIEDAVLEFVPRDVTVAVTASPTKGLETTLELAEHLRRAGYDVVPHVSARLVRDDAHLAEIVARLHELGIGDIFVPAGDADPPVGKFESSLSLLEALHGISEATERPLPRMGITGYPESHPKIGDDVTIQAMWDKRRYASYIVSNMCFDAATLKAWVHRVRARGVALPLRVGIAGPVDRTKLVSMASKIGVADSVRYLRSNSSTVLRLNAPGGYVPDRLLQKVGPMLADPASKVEGLHVFTFNQVRETELWRRELLERLAVAAAPGA